MYLVRLVYASRVNAHKTIGDYTPDGSTLPSIKLQAQKNNEAQGLTGMLVFNHQYFLQALEGSRSAVNQLLHKLYNDPRHHDMLVLRFEDITRREFPAWSMRFVPAFAATREILLRYGDGSDLDPYAMPGESAFGFLCDMAKVSAVSGH